MMIQCFTELKKKALEIVKLNISYTYTILWH